MRAWAGSGTHSRLHCCLRLASVPAVMRPQAAHHSARPNERIICSRRGGRAPEALVFVFFPRGDNVDEGSALFVGCRTRMEPKPAGICVQGGPLKAWRFFPVGCMYRQACRCRSPPRSGHCAQCHVPCHCGECPNWSLRLWMRRGIQRLRHCWSRPCRLARVTRPQRWHPVLCGTCRSTCRRFQ